MDIELMTLCDAATESAGKLNMLGAFDSIFVAKFPATHPQCAIALRMRYARIEEGEHQIRITMVDEDGHAVFPGFDFKVKVKCPIDQDSVLTNIIMNIQSLKFTKEGRYSIDLAVDGRHEKSLPLTVKRRTKQMPNLN
ncbi:MAG: hypothetical protein JXR37_13430 [Kiritimatiellae bacterium]|nr:hypothetical protein [Kiritimatiellia bacterium]